MVSGKATPEQIQEMLAELGDYIKLAIDVKRRVVAGGGELHADCEEVLLEEGSEQVDIWGADWDPMKKKIKFSSFINIRPKQKNRGMEVENPELRTAMEQIVRERLELP